MTATPQCLRVVELYDGQVTQIRLAMPPANILSARMMGELSAQLDEAIRRPRLKLIVLTGEGRHFSYGASVEEHLPGKVDEMLPGFHRLIGRIIDLPVPTLAGVSGLCLGGGFELALACSFLIAEEGAQFGVPEIQLGVFPPVAAALLPQRATGVLGMRLILTGEKVGAKALQEGGLVHSLCAAGGLEREIAAFIEAQILPKSASSLRLAHRAARAVVSEQYGRAIATLEQLYLGPLMDTHDAVEGITSFVEKRAPQWRDA